MKHIEDVFECPKCGENRIEEVLFDVMETSQVIGYDGACLEYGNVSNDGGDNAIYQCLGCGWKLPVDGGDNLHVYLANPDRECKPGCYKEPVDGTSK